MKTKEQLFSKLVELDKGRIYTVNVHSDISVQVRLRWESEMEPCLWGAKIVTTGSRSQGTSIVSNLLETYWLGEDSNDFLEKRLKRQIQNMRKEISCFLEECKEYFNEKVAILNPQLDFDDWLVHDLIGWPRLEEPKKKPTCKACGHELEK